MDAVIHCLASPSELRLSVPQLLPARTHSSVPPQDAALPKVTLPL